MVDVIFRSRPARFAGKLEAIMGALEYWADFCRGTPVLQIRPSSPRKRAKAGIQYSRASQLNIGAGGSKRRLYLDGFRNEDESRWRTLLCVGGL
jgi:hypothetical protein